MTYVHHDKIDGIVESLIVFFRFSPNFWPVEQNLFAKKSNVRMTLVDGDISTLRWYASRNAREFVLERHISWKMRRAIKSDAGIVQIFFFWPLRAKCS